MKWRRFCASASLCAGLPYWPTPARHETSENTPALAGLGLTPRERDVLRLMTSGQSNQDIADALFVSVGTVKVHVTHSRQRMPQTDAG